MKTRNSRKRQRIGDLNTEALIQIGSATIKQLEKMLVNPEVTVKEKTSAANVLSYHMNVLNRLLLQKGENEQFDDQNLCDFVRRIEPTTLAKPMTTNLPNTAHNNGSNLQPSKTPYPNKTPNPQRICKMYMQTI